MTGKVRQTTLPGEVKQQNERQQMIAGEPWGCGGAGSKVRKDRNSSWAKGAKGKTKTEPTHHVLRDTTGARQDASGWGESYKTGIQAEKNMPSSTLSAMPALSCRNMCQPG